MINAIKAEAGNSENRAIPKTTGEMESEDSFEEILLSISTPYVEITPEERAMLIPAKPIESQDVSITIENNGESQQEEALPLTPDTTDFSDGEESRELLGEPEPTDALDLEEVSAGHLNLLKDTKDTQSFEVISEEQNAKKGSEAIAQKAELLKPESSVLSVPSSASENKTDEPLLTKEEIDMLLEPMELKADESDKEKPSDKSFSQAGNGNNTPQKGSGSAFAFQQQSVRDIATAPERIKFILTQNVKEAQLSIKHEQLGVMKLKISINQANQLSVVINPQYMVNKTQSDAITGELKELLEANGLNVEDIELDNDNTGRNFREDEYYNEYNNGMINVMKNDITKPLEETKVLNTANLIDIYA